MKRRSGTIRIIGGAKAVLLAPLLVSCAGNFNPPAPAATRAATALELDQLALGGAPGARVSFHFSDYFTLTEPRPDTSCAGDAKNYYHPFALTMPEYPVAGYMGMTGAVTGPTGTMLFPVGSIDTSTSVHPSFIKNISVDLTNANASSTLNSAYSCSLGSSSDVPSASSCASFDYGAIGGIPTNMGGTILLVGGISDTNYGGVQSTACGPIDATYSNVCDGGMYSLGVNVLPATTATDPPNALAPGLIAATGPISTWSNLSAVSGYSGPRGLAGAAVAYNSALSQFLTFSGTVPFYGVGPTGSSAPTTDSFSYDLKTQTWSTLTTNSFVDASLQQMLDIGTLNQLWQKPSGARALMGYVPVQGYALTKMSSGGSLGTVATGATEALGSVDFTDRIFIVGGYGSRGYDSRRFNPTFGPDYADLPGASPAQWLDSYHTQQTFNQTTSTGLQPAFAGGAAVTAVGQAFAPARNNSAATGAGYVISVGGFDSSSLVTQNTAQTRGGLNIFNRNGGSEADTAVYSSITNDLSGTITTTLPIWAQFDDSALPASPEDIPWYGGASLIQGFNVNTNDLLYFGGTTCKNYLSSSNTPACVYNSSSRYYVFGTDPNTLAHAASLLPAGSAPQRAGMASARGLDEAGNVIVLAFGGVSGAAVASDVSIYYLYDAAGTPTWVTATAEGSGGPTVVADASLVFSHVTRKFYLFGGYNPSSGGAYFNKTWELSLSNGACAGAGTCKFTWRSLDTGGISCYPNCPTARRGHRMAEVNYYNRNRSGAVVTSGESTCSADAPCSFGIFMEGGTTDGTNYIADRWMFDPTANNGRGHWQAMTELPPRTLASMASVDYFVPAQNRTVHRAILFGGQTGLQDPAAAAAGYYFVPPTLGDTWMYDFDANTWNRVNLLGKGYTGGVLPGSISEAGARESYDATTPVPATANELAPPPLAGAQMVARTQVNATHLAGNTTTPLALPEIFLFGGRQKDGSFLPLDRMYKFCAGSTGEKPFFGLGVSQKGTTVGGTDDGTCDSYDTDNNPLSPSPSAEYKGRWLRKTPLVSASSDPALTLATDGSYLGAATYDPVRDLIISFGGLKSSAAVTDTTGLAAGEGIYEYTPPSSTMTAATSEGTWRAIAACDSTVPAGRYGHTINYDALNDQLIVIGGYSLAGTPLIQTVTYYDDRTFDIPEVWTAKRTDSPSICYTWRLITTFGNSIDIATQTPPYTGISHAASLFIPADGFNTGYYTLLDHSCEGAGPIEITDPAINKLMAGGAYIDIDRTQLGATENLLLNITYIPMGAQNQRSDGTQLSQSEAAVFRVHLMKTGLSTNDLRLVFQPRYLSYTDSERYPQTVQSLAVMAPANGQIRQDQLVLPISIDPAIDRIRIERYSGTGILIDANVVRLGNR